MLDIRLDFINNIQPGAIEKMTHLRQMYIAIDGIINVQGDKLKDNPAGLRAASLARTHLEISLQYAIKTLCLLGELKDNDKHAE